MSDPIVVFGAGGHARVVIDACMMHGRFEPLACLSKEPGSAVLGVPVHEEPQAEQLLRQGIRYAVVAIGENRIRQRVAAHAEALGFELVTIVSPAASVSRHAQLGRGVVVMAGAVIQAGASIGALAIVNTGATIDHDCMVGEAVHVAPGSTVCGSVRIGDRTWIGAGAVVIEGISIAADVFVGAGATVVADIGTPGVRMVGVPARVMERRS